MAPSTRPKRGHNILGSRIREARARLRAGMSQADLAAKLTIRGIPLDRASVTRIENGNRFIKDFEIRAIASVLRVSVSWLFKETDQSKPLPRKR
jgi:transcriptional regulator with XRE-family HTH domain